MELQKSHLKTILSTFSFLIPYRYRQKVSSLSLKKTYFGLFLQKESKIIRIATTCNQLKFSHFVAKINLSDTIEN